MSKRLSSHIDLRCLAGIRDEKNSEHLLLQIDHAGKGGDTQERVQSKEGGLLLS